MTAPGFGIYVHWPFCAAKCPYCDFNSHVRKGFDQRRWAAAIVRELTSLAARLDARPPVGSIFFGGGTPSLMEGETVEAILSAIRGEVALAPDCEVTLEANPTSTDAARFAAYARAGVNRVSIGVQALNDDDLKALGRWHSAQEAIAALAIARETFARISIDLIYARPGQSEAQWEDELSRALALGTAHLSAYQLTIEEGTPFAALHAAGRLKVPDDDRAAALYEVTGRLTAAQGLADYEVSNYARPGEESRHNLLYWRYGDYLGVGPGAHGRLTVAGEKIATETLKRPEAWLDQVEGKGEGLTAEAPIDRAAQAEEMLLMGLRLTEGIDPARYAVLAGRSFDAGRVAALIDDGLLERRAGRLAATRSGRLVLNRVIAELAAGLPSTPTLPTRGREAS